jgi:pimeloyl-ACP methyl ester carboxylesterase
MVLEGGWRFVSFGDLVRRDVTTRFGVIALWSRPDIFDALAKPVVLAIGGSFSPTEDLKNLPGAVGILADVCIMRLPGAGSPPLRSLAIADVTLAVAELIESTFPRRPVVLLGVSIGAVVALGVRAANIARVVAIEPPLVTGGLWPVVAPLREALGKSHDRLAHDMAFQAYGIGVQKIEDRNYLGVLQGLRAPTDVVLGEAPLEPERPVDRFPSLVGDPLRRELGRNPRVRLHVAPGAGHNVVGQAPRFVLDVVLEASRRASAVTSFDPAELDEALLESTPLTARRVLFWGAHGETFRAALRPANPKAEVALLGEGDLDPAGSVAEGFDAVVAATPPPPERLARLAAVLKPGGHLIARWAETSDALDAQLSPHRLRLRDPVDDAGTGVIRAQKCDRGETPAPALHVKTVVYAALLMDIRTRLPARGLKSDPELQIVYGTPPTSLPPLGRDTPKVLVIQRRADTSLDGWRPLLAAAIKEGWVVVLEYDDHPRLIAEIKGTSATEAEMLRLGFVHAVQTTTPPLVEAFRPYNPEVVMFPNSAFDLALFPEGERPRRVVYGGVLRGDYPVRVAGSLGPAIADHPDTEFVVIGDRAVFDALPTQLKQYHDYMSFEAYLRLMSECAISLSPIAPLPLRETKSDAKFIDGSRSGALTIASPTIYSRVIEHGVNGLLAPEVEDWAPLLSRALGDQALRSRLARKAWEYVRDERMFADQIALRREWYRDLWTRREALNEAVMRRMPGLREMVSG